MTICICPGCGRTGPRADFIGSCGEPVCTCGYELDREMWPTLAEMMAEDDEWDGVRMGAFLRAVQQCGKMTPEPNTVDGSNVTWQLPDGCQLRYHTCLRYPLITRRWTLWSGDDGEHLRIPCSVARAILVGVGAGPEVTE